MTQIQFTDIPSINIADVDFGGNTPDNTETNLALLDGDDYACDIGVASGAGTVQRVAVAHDSGPMNWTLSLIDGNPVSYDTGASDIGTQRVTFADASLVTLKRREYTFEKAVSPSLNLNYAVATDVTFFPLTPDLFIGSCVVTIAVATPFDNLIYGAATMGVGEGIRFFSDDGSTKTYLTDLIQDITDLSAAADSVTFREYAAHDVFTARFDFSATTLVGDQFGVELLGDFTSLVDHRVCVSKYELV